MRLYVRLPGWRDVVGMFALLSVCNIACHSQDAVSPNVPDAGSDAQTDAGDGGQGAADGQENPQWNLDLFATAGIEVPSLVAIDDGRAYVAGNSEFFEDSWEQGVLIFEFENSEKVVILAISDDGQPLWSKEVVARDHWPLRILPSGDRVYLVMRANRFPWFQTRVLCLSAEEGTTIWDQTFAETAPSDAALLTEGFAITGSSLLDENISLELIYLDLANGGITWRYSQPAMTGSSLVTWQGDLFARGFTRNAHWIARMDLTTGVPMWQAEVGSSRNNGGVNRDFTAFEGELYFGGGLANGDLVLACLGQDSGQILWEKSLPGIVGRQLVVDAGGVTVLAREWQTPFGNQLHHWSLSGDHLWETRTDSKLAFIAGNPTTLYLGTPTGVDALSLDDGLRTPFVADPQYYSYWWTYHLPLNPVPLVETRSSLFTLAGNVLWRYRLPVQ